MAPPIATEYVAPTGLQDNGRVGSKARGEATAPSIDAVLETVDDLVRHRAQLWPHTTIVSYPSSGLEYVDYTAQQLDVFAYRVAKHYQHMLPTRSSSQEKPRVVAMLGPSNVEYLVTMLGLIKLGHTILFLSTRISQEAVESLMKSTGAGVLLFEPRYAELAAGVGQTLPFVQSAEVASRPVFEFPVEAYVDTRLDLMLDHRVETSNNVYIIHSSGSTGFPKAIYQTHKAALANYAISMEMKAFITLPLYHNHGICNFFRAIYCGKSIHMYNADLPLTSGHLITSFEKFHFEIFYGVPYALKLLSESDKGIELLRQLKIVMYGGSACPDELGNLLVDRGVNLVSHYGATEVGQLMTSFRPAGDKVWNYVREHPKLSPFLKWVPRGHNLYECCVMDGWPSKLQSNQADGSYATKDLFEPHPTIPGAWKYIARLDDTLVLVNGEKFSPVQIEGRIRSDHLVDEAVVFGAGRPFLGLLVVPSESTRAMALDVILEKLWPTIEEVNQEADAFARISKNMVKILKHDTPFPRTDKGSVIRQAFYKAFATVIDEAYDSADTSSSDPTITGLEDIRSFLRGVTIRVLHKQSEVKDDTDFFSLGMDSLQALQLRSAILQNVDVAGKKLGMNVVFDYPSVEKLSDFLSSLRSGTLVASVPVEEQMALLVSKYATFAPRTTRRASAVVVTGATGSLGAHVVARLARDPSVKQVYCLVRAKDERNALERLRDSMMQRRVYHSLPLASRNKLLPVAFDQAEEHLGLGKDVYKAISRHLRSVIHCAWSVNFNLSLGSFEKDCIAGVHNLLNLCLASGAAEPASFNFCSSVSSVARCPSSRVSETLPDFSWAQGMGYAQSKSVAEHICLRAAELTGVKARVLRVGQVIADTQHGIWNAAEAIPMQIQTALTVGSLPRLPENPSWLPVDTVAQAVLDISLSDAASQVVNVANSRTFSWNDDLLPFLRASGLDFEEVEPREWVRRLGASNPDPVVNPPIKLLDFFASKYDKDTIGSSKSYETTAACALSPALARAPVLGPDLVKTFVGYFMNGPWKVSSTATAAAAGPEPKKKTAIILAGPCGSGTTTVGKAVAGWLRAAFVEGASLHRRRAVPSMGGGMALVDQDRWDWLDRIRSHVCEAALDLNYDAVVASCPALKRACRDRLRQGLRSRDGMEVLFIDLQASQEVLAERAWKRRGQEMTAQMVQGQIDEREEVQSDEVDVVPVSAEKGVEDVLEEVRWAINRALRLS